MFTYQTPITSFQRLLKNDQSGNFKIIFEIKYKKKTNDEFEVQKQKKFIINTTINKARLLSKKIDEQFANNQKIEQYVFIIGNLNKNGNNKCQFEDIINIMRALIESNGIEVTISEDKRNLFDQILNVLENGSGTIGLNVIKCKYLKNNKFNGIISYIKRITEDIIDGKNDHLRLLGGGNHPNCPLSNLLLYGDKDIYNIYTNGYYGEYMGKNAYIEFDFVNRKINMTSYTIRTAFNHKNAYHPKTWKMIGSNDHINWEIIDMKENNDELNDMGKCAHFECSTTTGKYYRIIRYVQMENWGTVKYSPFSHYVGLSAIEFFGSITSL